MGIGSKHVNQIVWSRDNKQSSNALLIKGGKSGSGFKHSCLNSAEIVANSHLSRMTSSPISLSSVPC